MAGLFPGPTSPAAGPETVAGVLRQLTRQPGRVLVRRWNWKSAVLSTVFRSLLFLAANWSAGPAAALAAMQLEFLFRAVAAGFFGSLTEAFRSARPTGQATLAAMVLLPLINHGLEFAVHWWGGTARLGTSMAASMAFTALSTAFNLHAMRHGALVVGSGRQPLHRDLARLPSLLASFGRDHLQAFGRLVSGARPAHRSAPAPTTAPGGPAAGGPAVCPPGTPL